MTSNLINNSDFKQWVVDLKTRIRQSQIKAAISVNSELLRLYWELGRDIVLLQMDSVWGSGFFEQLSKELKAEFPAMGGFSITNLKYCKRFYLFYTQSDIDSQQLRKEENNLIRHQVGDEFTALNISQIPWRHHIEIFTKCKSKTEALFYVQKTIQNGWSRAMLINFIEANLYHSQGKALNNQLKKD